MDQVIVALTFLGALGSGLMAGLFFVFSICIMTALGRLPRAGGIAAMQAINVAILNPVFLGVFFGTAAIAVVLAIAAPMRWSDSGAVFLLAGALLYLIGNILVTIGFNVPMNNRLAAVDPNSGEGEKAWAHYLSTWTAWNHVRTAACLASLAFFIAAL